MQINKLKGLLVEKGFSYMDMSKELNIGIAAFTSKINGNSQFKLNELVILKRVLEIDLDDFNEIFFE